MNYIIKDLEGVTLALFEAVGTDQEEAAEMAYNKAETENDRIFGDMMDQLRTGIIDAIQTEGSRLVFTYTRSAQTSGAIQRTTWSHDAAGDPLPLSHIDIFTEGNHRNATELYTPGIYETIIY